MSGRINCARIHSLGQAVNIYSIGSLCETYGFGTGTYNMQEDKMLARGFHHWDIQTYVTGLNSFVIDFWIITGTKFIWQT